MLLCVCVCVCGGGTHAREGRRDLRQDACLRTHTGGGVRTQHDDTQARSHATLMQQTRRDLPPSTPQVRG
jgi:hypothetical protein